MKRKDKYLTLEDLETVDPIDVTVRLTKLLGLIPLFKLIMLLEDVINETGYGDVKIIVAEGKVQMLKAEHSYKYMHDK